MDAVTGETVDLLQHLIRNACVNDGSPGSGGEHRSVDLLADYFGGSGLELRTFEPAPGRASLLTSIPGSDPGAPTLLWLAHTDVVPVNRERWRHDPFGAELIDGEVWGRGAIDMLNLTASMAVALRRLARTGFRPKGSLHYLAVADEEAGGKFGAGFLTAHPPDGFKVDYVITESGGFPMPSPAGIRLPVVVAEKGPNWCHLRVRGTPTHGSMPVGADNALVKAAEVVRGLDRYRPATRVVDAWQRFVQGMSFPAEMAEALLDPARLESSLEIFPPGMRRWAHACTHTTLAPTGMRAGSKMNVIPDLVDIEVDIRSLPTQTYAEIRATLDEALGSLAGEVEIVTLADDGPTASPIDTPLWDSLQRVTETFYRGSRLVPMMLPGTSDARFFRRQGAVGYGAGLFSERLSLDDLATMGHGDNERIDVDSLRMCTELWVSLAHDFLV